MIDVDIDGLALAMRVKRGSKGLRLVAAEVGEVSPSTLSRVENGSLPDLLTYVRLCRWLGAPLDAFVPAPVAEAREPILAHLRTDRTLSPETSRALRELVLSLHADAARFVGSPDN